MDSSLFAQEPNALLNAAMRCVSGVSVVCSGRNVAIFSLSLLRSLASSQASRCFEMTLFHSILQIPPDEASA
ncbi:MAG: hypothetical protein K2P00_03315, partial [Alistipes sp.]|nr:hypothetical protein [Alistipes sp.]